MRSRQEIYLDIIYYALLNIRGAGYQGDANQCHLEADHIHNMPELLRNLDKEELHDFYWRTMRSGYIEGNQSKFVRGFELLWEELEEATQRERQPD